MSLMLIDHPLIQHKITKLRDKHTNSKEFRELLEEISMLLCYEATKDALLTTIKIETPIATTMAPTLQNPDYVIIPILRAGIGMAKGVLTLLPTASVGHLGVYRDHETLKPIEYFHKMPEILDDKEILVLDPMLATGGTAIYAVDFLKKRTNSPIKVLTIITCPEGVKNFSNAYPDIPIYTAAFDEKLDENSYIVPGLGDAGDRLFDTK